MPGGAGCEGLSIWLPLTRVRGRPASLARFPGSWGIGELVRWRERSSRAVLYDHCLCDGSRAGDGGERTQAHNCPPDCLAALLRVPKNGCYQT